MVFLFWPLMILSVIFSLVGVGLRKSALLYISAIMLLPTSLYLAATPLFKIWGIVFPLFYVASAIFVRLEKTLYSIIMIVPVYTLIGWMAFTVLNQS